MDVSNLQGQLHQAQGNLAAAEANMQRAITGNRPQNIAQAAGRIAQIQRLRQDLGLNLVGAAMVIDLAQEIAQLRAQIKVLRS